jgi:hypothetical protein
MGTTIYGTSEPVDTENRMAALINQETNSGIVINGGLVLVPVTALCGDKAVYMGHPLR